MKKNRLLEQRLAAAGNGNPKRSVEELAAHVLGCKPLEVYFREMTPGQLAELEVLIVRAEQGEPVQYIIGCVDFRGLEIRCDRRALIPRPETEQLVEAALQSIINRQSSIRIADVGTGTGCIALALLAKLPNAEAVGVDISPDALGLARENAEQRGLSERFRTLKNYLLEGFEADSLDMVVSNPPYICSGVLKNLEPCVCDFEPVLALDGGEDGLDLIRPLAEQAFRILKKGGGLFLEIGYDQSDTVVRILEDSGFQQVEIKKDLAGLDRIIAGIRL